MERITSCLACRPLVHAVRRRKSSKQAANRGATLPGAPHKIFSPLQCFKRDLLRICSAVLHVQHRYTSRKQASLTRPAPVTKQVFPACSQQDEERDPGRPPMRSY